MNKKLRYFNIIGVWIAAVLLGVQFAITGNFFSGAAAIIFLLSGVSHLLSMWSDRR